VFEAPDSPDAAPALFPRLGKAYFAKKEEEEGAQDRSTWPKKRADNEKLDKFKFLLVNIEEDEDLLDPATFGVLGEYKGLDFDDYPPEVLSSKCALSDRRDSAGHGLGVGPNWIRKSFEKLDLDVVRTQHEGQRRDSRVAKHAVSTLPNRRKASSAVTPEVHEDLSVTSSPSPPASATKDKRTALAQLIASAIELQEGSEV